MSIFRKLTYYLRLWGTTTSPNGVTIRSMLPVSLGAKKAIEQGINETLRRVECRYPKKLTLRNFKVELKHGEPDGYGNPALVMSCGEYEGSVWCRADGTMLVSGYHHVGIFSDKLVLATFGDDTDLEYLALTAAYEAEHQVLRQVDYAQYVATRVHVAGGHPILAPCPGGVN